TVIPPCSFLLRARAHEQANAGDAAVRSSSARLLAARTSGGGRGARGAGRGRGRSANLNPQPPTPPLYPETSLLRPFRRFLRHHFSRPETQRRSGRRGKCALGTPVTQCSGFLCDVPRQDILALQTGGLLSLSRDDAGWNHNLVRPGSGGDF